MQDKVLPQASLIKGRFGGIVYVTEDISPPPATIKKEGKSNDLSSMVGHHIEIFNRFICDFEAATYIAKQCKTRSCHKPSFSKEGLGGL